MAEAMSAAALVGCTGLVGSQILNVLASHGSQPIIHAIARRTLSDTSANVRPVIEADNSKWPEAIKTLSPTPNIFISALGATRAQAGGFEAQRKVDFDLNLSLAKAAKESGVKVYVLISSTGASSKSMFPYTRTKGEIEDAVRELHFPHTVIVRPGLLIGTRSVSRGMEAALQVVARGMGSVNNKLKDVWAQDVDVIGKATVAAGLQCLEGKKEEGTWLVGQSEIIKLGRTDWKTATGST